MEWGVDDSMKRVCVLLAWPPQRDSRAQRTVRSMARLAEVDVFFPVAHNGTEPGSLGPNTRTFPIEIQPRRIDRVWQHSLFFLETRGLVPALLGREQRYDLVYAHDLVTSYAGIKLAQAWGARLVYDVHDLAVETLNQLFPRHGPLAKRFLYLSARWTMRRAGRFWERRVVRRADAVFTTNPNYRRYLEERYGAARYWVVPNYPEFREVARSRRLYEELGLRPEANVVLYHGVLGPGRSLGLIARSAAFLTDPNVLVIIGHGPLETALKAAVEREGLCARVRFLPHVPYERLFEHISGAALGLALIEPINLSKKYALANKVTEYMAAGVAVLASDGPENRRLLGEAGCGFVRDFAGPEELGAFINEIARDPEQLRRLGLNGQRAFRERFNWEREEEHFLEPIRLLLGAA
jgi:glycosyltransferase involved in cell wall biosynthesis